MHRGRSLVERLLRGIALVALVTAWWQLLQPSGADARARRSAPLRLSEGDSSLGVLQRAIIAEAAAHSDSIVRDTLVLHLNAVPGPQFRAALSSVRAAGWPVAWRDSTEARGLALSASRVPTPDAPVEVRAITASAQPLVLRDAGGLLDSVPSATGGASWRLASVASPLRARQGRATATVSVPSAVSARRVLVVGQPGWESKFVVVALEESGWSVDGSLRVSPSGVVTVGAPQALDTTRYAAVVVVDSMTVNAAAYARFVREGGGLVLGGDALRIPALSALQPARASERRGAIAGGLLTESPRLGLEAWEVTPHPDALVLQVDRGDHGHDEPALLARRIGRGRVVAMPYRETWRWRMQGTDDGLADHRAWWQAALAAAVPASWAAPHAASDPYPQDAAPWADLVALAGAPSAPNSAGGQAEATRTATVGHGEVPLHRNLPVLFTVALTALLAEWASRRLRGLR